jgi:hypothetical protein
VLAFLGLVECRTVVVAGALFEVGAKVQEAVCGQEICCGHASGGGGLCEVDVQVAHYNGRLGRESFQGLSKVL